MRTSARIEITATAIDAIHHGDGTSGNTSLQRQQRGVDPVTGDEVMTPFVSGNSLKHMIREHGVLHAFDVMGVPEGSLSKAVVDLAFSGGALTKSGASVDLARARKLEALFPILGLCGYSAGNTMRASMLRVDNLHLVCEENAWRAPPELRALPVSQRPAGYFLGVGMGTRHESTRNPRVSRMLTDGENARLDAAKSKALTTKHADKGDSAQMIYDYETIVAGSRLWGAIHVVAADELQMAALRAALTHACEGVAPDGGGVFRIGAKGSIGLGRVSMRFSGFVRAPVVPSFEPSEALSRFGGDAPAQIEPYAAHLRDKREEILAALEEAVS